jgi:hypothetical protein
MVTTVILRRFVTCLTISVLLLAGMSWASTVPARAAPTCASAITFSGTAPPPGTAPNSPQSGSPGNPCWTDVTPYPFGSDGNPVDPNSALCARLGAISGPYPLWQGDFNSAGGDVQGNPPCYLQVNSFAFRAWNRGLAATGLPTKVIDSGTVAFGVWLWNGTNWFPDPTFPGSNVCPGSEVLWAGKLDYWLIGPQLTGGIPTPETTLCRFDGVNLEWEPLSLPATTLAMLPTNFNGQPQGGITSGACYAWNNCWFFGNDGIEVHWDGQALTNASTDVGSSPWLDGDATAAVTGTDPSGNPFGLAVTKSTMTLGTGVQVPLSAAPDGSPPAQVFGSQGGPWTPLTYTSGASPLPNGTTDLTAVSANSEGDVWAAGGPNHIVTTSSAPPTAPAPLERLTETGAPVACSGYDANTFTFANPNGYQWQALSTFPDPDGGALAAAQYGNEALTWGNPFVPTGVSGVPDSEPQLVHAACGQPPAVTEFRRPDPVVTDQSGAPLIPADYGGYVSAVAANASNDAWAATTNGNWPNCPSSVCGGTEQSGTLAPHVYRLTDGEAPDAPAGDDNESRPSLFTLGPPVFQVEPPAVVVTPVVTTTTTTKATTTQRKLPPAIYDIHDKLRRSSHGNYTLYVTFKVRRAVTIGLEGLRGRRVVTSTGLKHFNRPRGQLALKLDRKHWPTRISLVTPK